MPISVCSDGGTFSNFSSVGIDSIFNPEPLGTESLWVHSNRDSGESPSAEDRWTSSFFVMS